MASTSLAPAKVNGSNRRPMARLGLGTKGHRIPLLTNHFNVKLSSNSDHFYQYSVAFFYEDGNPVEPKGVGRKVLDMAYKTYESEMGGKGFAYDGGKTLFTVGPLPMKKSEFTVILENLSSNRTVRGSLDGGDTKRSRRPPQGKQYTVKINYATKIPIQSIFNALQGQDSEQFNEAIRVLDVLLRQHAAKQEDNIVTFVDVSTTMIVRPGKVVDFLLENQNVRTLRDIDWIKAKRVLKSLRIKTFPSNLEYKIIGLSEKVCGEQKFEMKRRDGNSFETIEMTVYDYYASHHQIHVNDSRDYPCLNVGKPKRAVYIPLELCELLSLQRYTKSLSNSQRSTLVEKSRQKPQEPDEGIDGAQRQSNYAADPLINSTGITISTSFTQVEGRVLEPPKLKFGNGGDLQPRNGRWNFNNKQLDEPWSIIEESPQFRRNTPLVRVEKMFEAIRQALPGPPEFILCILPERKNSDIYGPWKRKCLVELGIITQCITPLKINDQYLTNLLLKINAKMGGINSKLSIEHLHSIPLVSKKPTIIFGMDVCHGTAGSDGPSIVAVVSSRKWPLVSHYRASVRTQSSKVEMIDGLFKPVAPNKDEGMIRELLLDFYYSTPKLKPQNIIIFRDGVSESQFNQVLNIELEQIMEACKLLDREWDPKFMVIVAQKVHHTKFFQPNSEYNVPPGTIIDNQVCHPKNNDFYLCAQNGAIGTTRPTHYHVLLDQIGFSTDELQEFCDTPGSLDAGRAKRVSVAPKWQKDFIMVAPVFYAHLAAGQMAQFIKFDEMSDVTSSHSGGAGSVGFTQMPKLHKNTCSSMFFC
ncbi:argonaute 4A-like protein [Tanacetum coccineum]